MAGADGEGPQLPAELTAALCRSATQTLSALHSLRVALREHVYAERADGASLADVQGGLRTLIGVAGGDSDHPAYSSQRIAELTSQVLKWSASFYTKRPGGRV